MIGMSSKETEEKTLVGAQRKSHQVRMAFWQEMLAALREAGFERFQNLAPTNQNWISASSGVGGCVYSMIFNQDQIRMEMNFERTSQEENKWFFDQCLADRKAIESDYGHKLDWHRLDDKKASRIKCCRAIDAFNRENWPLIIEWFVEHNRRMEETFGERLNSLARETRSRDAA